MRDHETASVGYPPPGIFDIFDNFGIFAEECGTMMLFEGSLNFDSESWHG